MSAECAILASDTAPVKEVLTEGETGWMVDFFDHKALVSRLNELLDDPETRKTLGQNARALVKANYDLQSICLPKHVAWVENLAKLPVRPVLD
jgi:glycosyltransferase involved in cell wall biosynthesis